jgi:hypothetical protein
LISGAPGRGVAMRLKQPVSRFAQHLPNGFFLGVHSVFPIAPCFYNAHGQSTTLSLVSIAAAVSWGLSSSNAAAVGPAVIDWSSPEAGGVAADPRLRGSHVGQATPNHRRAHTSR